MRLAEVICVLREQAEIDDHLSVQEVLDAFRARVYGPLLMLPAVIAVFPVIGALPGVSLAMASILTLGSLQLAIGMPKPWLPGALRRVSFSKTRAQAVLNGLEPWARRFDRLLRPRMRFLFTWPGIHLTGLLCVFVGLLTMVGALAPGLIVPPALLMILIAFALIATDGWLLAACAGLAVAIAAGGLWLVQRIDWPDWVPILSAL